MNQIDVNEGNLLKKVDQGLKDGMWFHRNGEKFYVPPENIYAYVDGDSGIVMIYFHSENPCTIATYSVLSYMTRWALKKEDLVGFVGVPDSDEDEITYRHFSSARCLRQYYSSMENTKKLKAKAFDIITKKNVNTSLFQRCCAHIQYDFYIQHYQSIMNGLSDVELNQEEFNLLQEVLL